MAPPKGHQYWKFCQYPGRPKTYAKPRDLWKAACGYFDWVHATPLEEQKFMAVDKSVVEVTQDKARAMSVASMCRHIGVSPSAWTRWKISGDEEYREVMLAVEDVIRDQKFTHAAAGLMNSALISRDLGLADKQELSGPGGKPLEMQTTAIDPSTLSKAALKEIMTARNVKKNKK